MPGFGQGYKGTVFTANTAGTLVGCTAPATAIANSVPTIAGIIHTLTIGVDSTAETISIYDGTSTGGTLVFKTLTSTSPTIPVHTNLDIQCNVGIFIVISGGTAVNVCLTYA